MNQVRKDNRRFGTLARKKGFIKTDQIIEALSIQLRENIHKKRYRPLGEILEQLGYMNAQQIKEVLETKFEKRFGELSISKGFVTLDQLIDAMRIQVEGDTEEGQHLLLGEILAGMDVMNEVQVREVLDEM